MNTVSNMAPRPIANGASHTPALQPQVPRPSPSITPNPYQHQSISPAPQYGRQSTFSQSQTPYRANIAPSTATATQQNHHSYTGHQAIHPQASLTPAHTANYASATPTQTQVPFSRPLYQQQTSGTAPTSQSYSNYPSATPAANSTYPDHRAAEVFVLSDTANASIPKHIRERFPQDDQGRVLFYTKPPVVHDTTARGKEGQVLKHTEKYLEAKQERELLKAERKRAREVEEKSRQEAVKRVRV